MATSDPPSSNRKRSNVPGAFEIKDLQTPANPHRRRVVSLLRQECLIPAPQSTVRSRRNPASPLPPQSTLVEDLLHDVCGGSDELMAEMLQARFIDNRTPLWFLASNLDIPKKINNLPPTLEGLLNRCGPVLAKPTIRDLELACTDRDHDALFQALRRIPKFCPDEVPTGFAPPTVTDGQKFHIPDFLDCMLASVPIRFEFIAQGCNFTVQITSSAGSWTCRITHNPRRSSGRYSTRPPGYVILTLEHLAQAQTKHHGFNSGDKRPYSDVSQEGFDLTFLRHRNDHISPTGELKGNFSFSHW